MSRKSALCFMILFLVRSPAFADRVYLKNGNRIDGRILEENQSEITVEVEGGTVKLGQFEIERIVKEEWAPEPKRAAVPAVPTPAAVKAAQAPAPIQTILRPSTGGNPSNSARDAFLQGFQKGVSGNWRQDLAKILPFKLSPWILAPLALTAYVLFIGIQALWSGLLIKLFMKFFDEGIAYLAAVFFQLRLAVVSTIAFVLGIGIPLAIAYFAHMSPGGTVGFTMFGLGISGLIMLVLFFVYTGRYLGLGFVKSLGLIIWIAFIQFAIQFGAGFAVGMSR